MKRSIIAAAILALGMICAAAQVWPTKLVKIIVPFAAGATPDLVARLIADDLQTRLILLSKIGLARAATPARMPSPKPSRTAARSV